MVRIGITCNQLSSDGRRKVDSIYKGPTSSHSVTKQANLAHSGRTDAVDGADQVARIAGSMAEFGWTVPVLVSGDGEVIAGHGWILAAAKSQDTYNNTNLR